MNQAYIDINNNMAAEQNRSEKQHNYLFETLFRSHYKPLCVFVYNLIKDQEAAEDIVQEVFVKVWNNREKIDTSRSVKSYLFKAAYNQTLNYIDKNKFMADLSDYAEAEMQNYATSADQDLQLKEIEKQAERAINQLPVKCKAVFLMCRKENMTYREVADAMNISVKTVENQMGKALKSLRLKLAPYLDYIPFYILLMIR